MIVVLAEGAGGVEIFRLCDCSYEPLYEQSDGSGRPDIGSLDLHPEKLLRSYRADEWAAWFEIAGTPAPTLRGPMFDSSVSMTSAAMAGFGVALAPAAMFQRELAAERLIQPFAIEVDIGHYWLTRLHSRKVDPAMQCFRDWLVGQTL